MNEHTKELLKVIIPTTCYLSYECYIGDGNNFGAVAFIPKSKARNGLENGRRIVACWNACSEIPTEDLEESSMTILEYFEDHYAEKLEKLQKQRDELLTALKLARVELDKLPHSLGYDFDHIPAIDAIIAKATA